MRGHKKGHASNDGGRVKGDEGPSRTAALRLKEPVLYNGYSANAVISRAPLAH
jgi:hypothetical protein